MTQSKATDKDLSWLIFKEGDYWVAQCVEYDITTQVRLLKEIGEAIEYAIVGHIAVSKEIGQEPFECLPDGILPGDLNIYFNSLAIMNSEFRGY